jgi:hypothetical protein
MTEPNYERISVNVGGENIVLDPANLKFNEATLSSWLDHEHSWVDYFGRALSNAESELSAAKESAEIQYFRAFDAYKSEGSTEKRAEAQARIETGVINARQQMRDAEKAVKLIKQHLRSFDKAHENAISLGHNLRKEMSSLSPRIYGVAGGGNDSYESKLQEIMGRDPKKDTKEAIPNDPPSFNVSGGAWQ